MATQITLVAVHGILSDGGAWDPLLRLVETDPELAGHVRVIRVEYPTKLVEIHPKKTMPDLDTVADYLGTQLAEEVAADEPVLFAAHSQGGLVVQRYVSQQLGLGHGLELQRIRRILLFATPNSGSEYLLPLRKWWSRHPQEIMLRPLNDQISQTRATILKHVINAAATTAHSVQIPVEAYAGMADGVVLPQSALADFPNRGVIPGDHSSIIRPASTDDLVYRIVKNRLLREIQRTEHVPAQDQEAQRVAQQEAAIAAEIKSHRATPLAGRRLESNEVREIATALANIPDLVDPTARRQFVMMMPPYIRAGLPQGSGTLQLEMGALVTACAHFENIGREALVVCIVWSFAAESPAVAHALSVIDRLWTITTSEVPTQAADASHPV